MQTMQSLKTAFAEEQESKCCLFAQKTTGRHLHAGADIAYDAWTLYGQAVGA
jgi:hypothetical protein